MSGTDAVGQLAFGLLEVVVAVRQRAVGADEFTHFVVSLRGSPETSQNPEKFAIARTTVAL